MIISVLFLLNFLWMLNMSSFILCEYKSIFLLNMKSVWELNSRSTCMGKWKTHKTNKLYVSMIWYNLIIFFKHRKIIRSSRKKHHLRRPHLSVVLNFYLPWSKTLETPYCILLEPSDLMLACYPDTSHLGDEDRTGGV